MFKKTFLLRFFIIALIFFANNSLAQDVVDDYPNGSVNWSKGIVTAKGSGVLSAGAANPAQARLLAERAAISDARRNLLETVGEVRVDAASSVTSLMVKNDAIKTRISGIVKGSVVIGKQYLEDGSVEVTVEMPITGALLDVMLTEVRAVPSLTMTIPVSKPVKKKIPKMEIKSPAPEPEAKKTAPEPVEPAVPSLQPEPAKPSEPVKEAKVTPEPAKPEVHAEPAKKVIPAPEAARLDLTKVNYSGLIIDAREVDVKPALLPKVLDEKGDVIYSSANMQKEDAVKTGVVGYAKEVDAAKKHPRVTDTPIVIAALKGSGEKRSDVVLSDRDALVITTTEPAMGYLNKGRVMIVYK